MYRKAQRLFSVSAVNRSVNSKVYFSTAFIDFRIRYVVAAKRPFLIETSSWRDFLALFLNFTRNISFIIKCIRLSAIGYYNLLNIDHGASCISVYLFFLVLVFRMENWCSQSIFLSILLKCATNRYGSIPHVFVHGNAFHQF